MSKSKAEVVAIFLIIFKVFMNIPLIIKVKFLFLLNRSYSAPSCHTHPTHIHTQLRCPLNLEQLTNFD